MVVTDAPWILWTLRRRGSEFRCEARMLPVGIEGRTLWNGCELYEITLADNGEQCVWAREKRDDFEGDRWVSADKEH